MPRPVQQPSQRAVFSSRVLRRPATMFGQRDVRTRERESRKYHDFVAKTQEKLQQQGVPVLEQQAALRSLRHLLVSNNAFLTKVMDSAVAGNDVHAELAMLDPAARAALVAFFLKAFMSQKISTKMLVLLSLAAAVPGAFAQNVNVTANAGIPTGGSDLCKGLLSCQQGWLSDPDTQRVLSQYSMSVYPTTYNGVGSTGYVQLGNCFNQGSLGAYAIDSWNKGTSATGGTCIVQSTQYLGNQLVSYFSNLPGDACLTQQMRLNLAAQQCMTQSGQAMYSGIIVGSIIGGIALIIAAALAINCACRRKCTLPCA